MAALTIVLQLVPVPDPFPVLQLVPVPDPLPVCVVEAVAQPLRLQELVALHVQEERLPSPGGEVTDR